ncbi:hypothetical protein ACFYKX_00335 [Cytobacillus sp. FJAT-54145]|uniref:Flagellar hook-length control protein FliK n=1 Tax=Cytobacillus spartinae TaxID=3299023 RepID=A0ABW6K4F1_9BACI
MVTASIIQSLLKESAPPTEARGFRPGQIINGKIIKLFPNQIAEVQVGNQKVIAQLEVPLSANERYWFQVQSGEGKIHLKVLPLSEGSFQKGGTASIEGLIKQLSLPQSKENIELVAFFAKERLPISKEILQLSAEWLKGNGQSKEGLEAIKQMLTKDLPLTKETFLSMKANIKSESMNVLLSQLHTLLDQGPSSVTGDKLIQLTHQLTISENHKLTEQVLTQLLKTWLSTPEQGDSQVAFKLLQRFGLVVEGNESVVLRNGAEQLLKTAEDTTRGLNHEVSRNLSLVKEVVESSRLGNQEEFIGKVKQYLANNPGSSQSNSVVSGILNQTEGVNSSQNDRILNSVMKSFILSIIQQTETENVGNTISRLVLPLLSSNGDDVGKINLFNQNVVSVMNETFDPVELLPNNQIQTQLKAEEKMLLRSLLTVINEGAKWEDSTFVSEQLRKIIKDLGLSYEKDLLHSFKQTNAPELQRTDTLKSVLIQYLNETPPPHIRDVAEQLLHKITGVQLMSQETGPLQQYVMQIPLPLFQKTTDLTIQWSGRKKENGEIDSNYCRVLFYLDLENLNETIVDMQVQNRIMNITIFNDTERLKKLATPLIPILKENLARNDYKLSSIYFQKSSEQKTTLKKHAVQPLYDSSNYNGVDIRV